MVTFAWRVEQLQDFFKVFWMLKHARHVQKGKRRATDKVSGRWWVIVTYAYSRAVQQYNLFVKWLLNVMHAFIGTPRGPKGFKLCKLAQKLFFGPVNS